MKDRQGMEMGGGDSSGVRTVTEENKNQQLTQRPTSPGTSGIKK